MKPLASAMTTLRELLAAALKSLLRGRAFLRALLTFWSRPGGLKSPPPETIQVSSASSIQDFLKDVEALFLDPTRGGRLKTLSAQLRRQFRHALRNNASCMLPSFNHTLPTGAERGQYLALDVGGSTLRVALVELRGRQAAGKEREIVCMRCFKIGKAVRDLEGLAFFEWMAARILETISNDIGHDHSPEKPIPMSMAWSFPVEQTSLRGGLVQAMGKSFKAADGLLGQDLGLIIQTACTKVGLNVELAAILNDSTACLLSEAYLSSSTRFGLILGTGVNIAAYLPLAEVGMAKYGNRPPEWFDSASHLVVNSELGMHGHGVLPWTRWDKVLQAAHPRPDFQPLEYLVSGQYIGEICRLVLVEAVGSHGLFGGILPPSLKQPYALDTETIAIIEGERDVSMQIAIFKSRHPSPVEPTAADMSALRTISSYIARRSSAIVAASIVALWELKIEAEGDYLAALPPSSPFVERVKAELALSQMLVAFNGSVIENYPDYLVNCQGYIDDLAGKEDAIRLVAAKESSLLGAAVSLACLEELRDD